MSRGSMFGSLAVRNYRIFALGQIPSLVGVWMQWVAQDWLVLELSGNSGVALGVVTALQFTPVLAFTLYAGVLTDRLDKRLMLAITQTAMMLLALGMGLLVISGAAQLWHVYVFAALLGTASAFDTPARQAFVSEMVGPDRVSNAVALNSAIFNTARLTGPALGGLVIAWLGVGPAFVINGVTFVAVLVAYALMRPGELVRGAPVARARGQLVEGLRYVGRRPDLLLVVALVAVVGTMGMNFPLTLALLAKAEFGVGAAQFGLLSSAFAAGALAGALVGARRRGRPSATLLLVFAAVFGALETAVAFAPRFAIAALVLVPTGAFLIAHNNVANARIQLGTPAHLRGRVMSLYLLVLLGGTPLGSLVVGWVCARFGARAGLALGGLSVLAAAGVLALVRAWRRSPRRRVGEPPERTRPPVAAAPPLPVRTRIADSLARRPLRQRPPRPERAPVPGPGGGVRALRPVPSTRPAREPAPPWEEPDRLTS